ncbi:MAG: hypothetical protein OEY94_06790 [Alphaproteobacteria bacterium]|nr:hypothetical protein [Alphaproteobacteria bacterium]
MNEQKIENIGEPKITFKSIEGDQVTCAVSPEWKQHLVDFLSYAHDTDDVEVDCFIPQYEISVIRDAVASQIEENEMVLPNHYFSMISTIFNTFSHVRTVNLATFYDPTIFCRLHDDIETVAQRIYNFDPAIKLRMPELLVLQAKEIKHVR